MTNDQTPTLVLKDETGNYYLLPLETLEQGRVPEEQTVNVERLLAERDDVRGHILPFVAGMVVGIGTVALGYGIGKATQDEGGTMTNAQFVEQVTGRPFGR